MGIWCCPLSRVDARGGGRASRPHSGTPTQASPCFPYIFSCVHLHLIQPQDVDGKINDPEQHRICSSPPALSTDQQHPAHFSTPHYSIRTDQPASHHCAPNNRTRSPILVSNTPHVSRVTSAELTPMHAYAESHHTCRNCYDLSHSHQLNRCPNDFHATLTPPTPAHRRRQ